MRLRTVIAALAIAVPTLVQATEPQCYALQSSGLGAQALDDLVITGSGSITFTYAGHPQIPYEDDCDIEGRTHATCPLDCDGGIIRLLKLPEGLLASFSRRIESVRFDSVISAASPLEATGQSLVGTYLMAPAPEAVCREISERKPDLTLVAGAHFPGVERLEEGLSAAGYFTGIPDWRFTSETENAVKAAQLALGFEPTGEADRAFLRVLAKYAVYATGGC
ncbi:MAG: peptidoglycan-binding domain-containing protein [Pseudomonadota bacterium]